MAEMRFFSRHDGLKRHFTKFDELKLSNSVMYFLLRMPSVCMSEGEIYIFASEVKLDETHFGMSNYAAHSVVSGWQQ